MADRRRPKTDSSFKMEFTRLLALTAMISWIGMVQGSQFDPIMTFDVLYNAGIEAYVEEKWSECATLMSQAIADYKDLQNKIFYCRHSCEVNTKAVTSDPLNFLELSFFDTAMRRSDCIRRCKKINLPGRYDTTSLEIVAEFEDLQPYDYLQICAFNSEDYKTAAAASLTYLLRHPDHETMQDNVVYYRSIRHTKNEYFVNLELKNHQDLYMKGVDSYGREDYASTVTFIEGALVEFYKEEKRCSLACEGFYDHESLPDFYNAIADHWADVLRCKQKCPTTLSTINGAVVENLLPEHYNYLQFSYFKENNLKKAASCAATYLMFKPQDETMLQNKVFYLSVDGISDNDFVTREDAYRYHTEQNMQQNMLRYVDTRYKYSDADEDVKNDLLIARGDYWVDPTTVDPHSRPQEEPVKYFSNEQKAAKAYGARDADNLNKFNAMVQEQGGTVNKLDAEDNDKFVVDGLLDAASCSSLIGVTTKIPSGNSQQTSDYEQWSGLGPVQVAQLAKNGTISFGVAASLFNLTGRVKQLISQFYNLQWPLLHEKTQISCQQGTGDHEATFIQSSSEAPWRDFSAVVYLNRDLEEGKLAFGSSTNITNKVSPACGRLVAFNASDPHSVLPWRGQQCMLGLWFTLDPDHEDLDQKTARVTMNALREIETNPVLKRFTVSEGIDLILTEEELNGPERFAADDLLQQDDCEALMDLAKLGGVAGDGYAKGGLTSVHTENESFIGLTVSKAAQQAANNVVSVDWVKKYINHSNRMKDLVAKYFHLKQPLYFDYTHLVCRTALHDKDKIRTDLSHPVHSDNCIIQADNSCKKAPPAYTQRDYSALTYLNDDFEGGDFFFTHQNMSIQSTVRPKCGRIVGFNAGNYHGVRAVTSGSRCALASWFTLDKRFDEAAFGVAANILNELESKPLGPPIGSQASGEL